MRRIRLSLLTPFLPRVATRAPLVLVISLALLSSAALADVRCRVEISYSWRKTGVEESAVLPWGILSRKGRDEESTKIDLAAFVLDERIKAKQHCSSRHENLAGCIAAKYSSMEATIKSLDFGARNTLDSAIKDDCKNMQGVCLEVTSTDPVCNEIVIETEGEEAPTEEGEEEEKDKKKKKKKH